MRHTSALRLRTLGLFMVVVLAAWACKPGPAPSVTPTATQPPTGTATATPVPSPGQAVEVYLTARNILFDQSTITVPRGANVVVYFDNQDAAIPHNFAVYENLSGGQTRAVFIGDTIVGPATVTYQFTAPQAQGSYTFYCDIHPLQMSGEFKVT